jgi:ABC-type antimicrobial peptide transport system permease subunit
MIDVSAASAAPSRFNAWLMAIFGAAAVVLAAIGVFAVVASTVNERTRDIGIRVALGADRATVRWMVVRQGMRVSLAGIAIGTAAALALARVLDSVLFGVDPRDWIVFSAMPALLASVALLAIWWPVRRATTIDPLTALRHD